MSDLNRSKSKAFSLSTAKRVRSIPGVGHVLSRNEKLNSIAHSKQYSESGRVVDETAINYEERIAAAMKSRRARRDEIVGARAVNGQLARLSSSASLPGMKIPRFEKSKEHYELIKGALDRNILFNDCSEEQIRNIIYAMRPKKIAKNTKIIVQGDEGFNFYVVQKGHFFFFNGGEKIGEAKGGDSFGELALLYYSPRSATVISQTSCEVWKLDRNTFRQILDSSYKIKRDRIRDALKKAPFFSDFDDAKLEQVVDIVHFQSFRRGDVIIRKDDEGSIFYLIVAGKVQVTYGSPSGSMTESKRENMNDTQLGPGDYFGERALLTNELRNENVIAVENTDVIALDRQSFNKYLGDYIEVLNRNLGLRVLKSVDILNDLTDDEFDELCDQLMTEEVKRGTEIFHQGDPAKKFYVIKQGKVNITQHIDGVKEDILIATLGIGSYFGEMALLDASPRNATATATTDVVVFSLGVSNFEKLFGPLESLGRVAKQRKTEMKKKSSQFSSSTNLIEDEAPGPKRNRIKLDQLKMVKTLGTGTFGRVKLAQDLATGKTYALKVLQKQNILQYKQEVNVVNEKTVLIQVDHPFILKLYETYADKNCLYMLLELVQGGELFSLLHNAEENRLVNDQAKFYAAAVIDALHYLHDRHIVYRDLKPENLMIDTVGYIKMVDFGFAKKVTKKTYTLCGTPEYLAPELVLQKGHDRAVDYWAAGVLIFEMLAGVSPFADLRRNEQITICRNIVRLKYDFPQFFPADAKDMVKKLLQRYPHERLGMAKDGTQEIKDHEWFQSINFDDLCSKTIRAPWKPEIKNNLDVSCFDEYEEDEQVVEYTGPEGWADNF